MIVAVSERNRFEKHHVTTFTRSIFWSQKNVEILFRLYTIINIETEKTNGSSVFFWEGGG